MWRPMIEAPYDGSTVWAWLHQTGIRKVFWMSPEACAQYEGGDPEDYDGCWVQVDDHDEEWSPEFWAPLSAIPDPTEAR